MTNRRGGFTLIEVSVSLAIIALGVALAWPDLRRWVNRESAARDAFAAANQALDARAAAVRRR